MMKNIAEASFLAILIICLSACNTQRKMTLTGYDRDRDNRVNREEFESVFRDRNTYSDWDTDGDRRLNEVEWERGFNVYSSDYNYDEMEGFDEWDTERDDYIDENEFREGFFNLFDANDNDYLEESEFASYQGQ
ncbi:hypothetical protein GCM10009122_29890 [Fulvivirga kasyanovii]|uniref:EF-hand domain-containing protein n=1 Tax=Fulvivirga kasyanovii TaxID=396812 RepID=A0ABW9RN70_9BACT|nr:hypothetical protein [Fulvivirga kasyanovii]MTI24798.1 hypothetical protein [Fulvivirga kasyanovii]